MYALNKLTEIKSDEVLDFISTLPEEDRKFMVSELEKDPSKDTIHVGFKKQGNNTIVLVFVKKEEGELAGFAGTRYHIIAKLQSLARERKMGEEEIEYLCSTIYEMTS